MLEKRLLKRLAKIVLRMYPNTNAPNERKGREQLDRELRELMIDVAISCVDQYVDGGHGSGWEAWKRKIRKNFRAEG